MNPLRRLWPRRNELMRPADWLEAALLVAVITIALVMLPIAAALGSETYANQLSAAVPAPAPAEPITTQQSAALAGLAVAMGLWITTLAALAVLFVLARFLLNRHRRNAWHRDWLRVAQTWTRNR